MKKKPPKTNRIVIVAINSAPHKFKPLVSFFHDKNKSRNDKYRLCKCEACNRIGREYEKNKGFIELRNAKNIDHDISIFCKPKK